MHPAVYHTALQRLKGEATPMNTLMNVPDCRRALWQSVLPWSKTGNPLGGLYIPKQ